MIDPPAGDAPYRPLYAFTTSSCYPPSEAGKGLDRGRRRTVRTPHRALTIALLLGAALATPALAGLDPEGSEIVVNATTSGDQGTPRIAGAPDGRAFVTWLGPPNTSRFTVSRIYGRVLDASGATNNAERVLRELPMATVVVAGPEIASSPEGGFLLVWMERALEDPPPTEYRMLAQRFDANAFPLAAPVPLRTMSLLPVAGLQLAVASLAGGGYAVLHRAGEPIAQPRDLFVLRLDAAGAPIGDPIQASATELFSGVPADLAPLADGGFVASWVGADASGRWESLLRVFDANGAPRGPAFAVSDVPAQGRRWVRITAAGRGFAAAWFEELEADAGSSRLVGGFFAADGNPRGGPFQIASAGGASESAGADLTADAAGNLAVAWGVPWDAGTVTFVARAFEARGAGVGPAELLSTHPASREISIDRAGTEAMVAAWVSGQSGICDPSPCTIDGLDGDMESVSARRMRFGLTEPLLAEGRYRVWIERPGSDDPAPEGVALTADSALFRFFAPDNVEVVVKLVDGAAVNGKTWVFSTALTDLAHNLVVRDEASGFERRYPAAAGALRSFADTNAFPSAGWGAPFAGWASSSVELLLVEGRFSARVHWSVPGFGEGDGPGRPHRRPQRRLRVLRRRQSRAVPQSARRASGQRALLGVRRRPLQRRLHADDHRSRDGSHAHLPPPGRHAGRLRRHRRLLTSPPARPPHGHAAADARVIAGPAPAPRRRSPRGWAWRSSRRRSRRAADGPWR